MQKKSTRASISSTHSLQGLESSRTRLAWSEPLRVGGCVMLSYKYKWEFVERGLQIVQGR